MINIKASKKNKSQIAFIKNWRFRSQVLCAQTISIIIVTLIGSGYFIFIQSYLIQEISNNSFIILVQRILSKQSCIYSSLNKKQLQQGLMLHSYRLDYSNLQILKLIIILYNINYLENWIKRNWIIFAVRLQQIPHQKSQIHYNNFKYYQTLFEYQQAMNITNKNHIENCNEFYNPSNFFSYLANTSCYCYGQPNNITDYSQHQDKMQLGTLLLQTFLIQNSLYRTYFAANAKDQFYVFQPCKYYPSTYDPQLRPWYLNHNQSVDEVQNSQPYIAFSGGITLTKTLNLKGLGNKIQGIIATDIIMQIFFAQNNTGPIDFILIDQLGKILLSNHYTQNSTSVDFYYNQSVSGFDNQDFQTILNFTKGLNYTNYCEIPLQQTLCLHDKSNNKEYYIKVQKLEQENYYLISKFDQQLYKQNVEVMTDEINTTSKKIIQDFMLGVISSLFLCGCCYLSTIFILEKPLYKLMNLSLKPNLKLTTIFQKLSFQQFSNDTIDRLVNAFTELIGCDNRLKQAYNNKTKKELEDIFPFQLQDVVINENLLLLIQEKLPDYKKQNKSLFYLNSLDKLKIMKDFLIKERKILSI